MSDASRSSEIALGSSQPAPALVSNVVSIRGPPAHSAPTLPRSPRDLHDLQNSYPPLSLTDKRVRSDPNVTANSSSKLYPPSPTVPSTSGFPSATSSPTIHQAPPRAPSHASPRIGGAPRSISGGPG